MAAMAVTSAEMPVAASVRGCCDGGWANGGAVDKVNGIQETGSSPCAVIKARSGPQLMLLHSGPRFFFVNRDVLSR